MQFLHKIVDWIFARFPTLKEFCFLAFPLSSDAKGIDGLFHAAEWNRYLQSHADHLNSLPNCLDQQSRKWVKRLLERRKNIRYFLTIGEIYRYYKSKHLQIPYWFPEKGTLIKSVFWHQAGIRYIPQAFRSQIKGRIAIDGGPASGDSSLALLDCGASRILAFEPSPCQREEMNTVFQRNRASERVEIIPYALDQQRGQIVFSDQYGKDFISETISIDEYCAGKDIGCIKLDIEGAEFPTIRGAERTIARCRPILLICAYHRPEDLFEMPVWIHKKFPFYKFCLRDTEPGNRGVGAHLVLIGWPAS